MINPVESIRHAVEEITNHGPGVALGVVEPLRTFSMGLAHVGKDAATFTPQEKLEWYAGQLIQMADSGVFAGFPALSLALDKFVPAVQASTSGTHPLDPPFVPTITQGPSRTQDGTEYTDNPVRKLYGEGREEEASSAIVHRVTDAAVVRDDEPCEGNVVLHLGTGVTGKVVKIYGNGEYTPPKREGDEDPKPVDAPVVYLDSGDALLLGEPGSWVVLNLNEQKFTDGFFFALGSVMLGAGLTGERMDIPTNRYLQIITAVLMRQTMMMSSGDV